MHRVITAAACVFFYLPIGTMVQARSFSGGITGVVSTEDGKPVTAQIQAVKLNPYPPQSSVRVTTGAGGTFQFHGLLEGPWQLCAWVPGGGYLDPCQWESSGVAAPCRAERRLTSS